MTDRVTSAAGRAGGEGGFTVVEVLVAVLVLTVGLITLVAAFDPARRLGTTAEMRQVASGMAEQEIQRVQALPWAKIALASAPTVNSGATAKDPTHYISNGPCIGTGPVTSPCYQWDWSTVSSAEGLDVDATNADGTANPQAWTTTVNTSSGATRFSGKTYRFITWANDTECTQTACGGTNDYKRVTVAVTVNGLTTPIVESTLVTNPVASNGASNDPLADPSVTCVDGTTTVPCIG